MSSADADVADVAAGSAATSGDVQEALKQYLLKMCAPLLDTDDLSWRVGLDSAAAQVRPFHLYAMLGSTTLSIGILASLTFLLKLSGSIATILHRSALHADSKTL